SHSSLLSSLVFFISGTASSEISTLSLHDALPILFGVITYRPGDYIIIPVGTIYRVLPDPGQQKFLVVETTNWITTPKRYRNEHRSEEHTSELQSRENLVCRLLLEKKNKK